VLRSAERLFHAVRDEVVLVRRRTSEMPDDIGSSETQEAENSLGSARSAVSVAALSYAVWLRSRR
jgi:hypothetical protein